MPFWPYELVLGIEYNNVYYENKYIFSSVSCLLTIFYIILDNERQSMRFLLVINHLLFNRKHMYSMCGRRLLVFCINPNSELRNVKIRTRPRPMFPTDSLQLFQWLGKLLYRLHGWFMTDIT